LAFKINAILHNTLLATFIKLLETVSKVLFKNRSQNRCHTFLDCRHVCKMCAYHDALQEGKQKEVHRTPLIWHPQAPDQGSMVSGLLRHTMYIVVLDDNITDYNFEHVHPIVFS
jgi:hypothetical protein